MIPEWSQYALHSLGAAHDHGGNLTAYDDELPALYSTFDLVLLDYAMPGMQGWEVALNIRRIAPALPILMVTAYLEKLSGIDTPVNAVLGKPFAMDELRSAIAKLVCPERRNG